MTKERLFSELLGEIEGLVSSQGEGNALLERVCGLLKERVESYDWVGFYLVDVERERELVLGPFAGEPTDHKRIRFGQGICGQAADLLKVFIVPDVTKESNYLSCNARVRSEIVIPLFRGETLVGELDIDSHLPDPFDEKDRLFLEKVGALVVPLL
ncbi:MAG TPA: GAF domain-containing protein [Candidatus Aminicenantes bacterium]|nr:GAF domain-containing protein [Candidatus Aminicenantes bacterium]HPB56783.1 GAF domain-containing protein [Candidatus Aminicenantes bacterium]